MVKLPKITQHISSRQDSNRGHQWGCFYYKPEIISPLITSSRALSELREVYIINNWLTIKRKKKIIIFRLSALGQLFREVRDCPGHKLNGKNFCLMLVTSFASYSKGVGNQTTVILGRGARCRGHHSIPQPPCCRCPWKKEGRK